MSFLQSLILGIIQGITEFLPISSSAHLVLIPHLLGWNFPESQVFPFDVLVQLGTLVSVIIYFWTDLWSILKTFFRGLIQRKPFEATESRLGWYLILATIPAGFAGVLLKNQVETAFNSPRMTAWFLFGTAALLLIAEFFSRRTRQIDSLKWYDALWIGVFQAISIFPGVSRSGSTITGGMTRDLDRPSAARFSFLMSIPVMIAAGIFSVSDLLKVPNLASFLPVLLVGFLAALVVGYLAIHWLLSFLGKHSLVWFAAYCALLAVVVLLVKPANVNGTSLPTATTVPTVEVQSPTEAVANTMNIESTASLSWMTPAMSACANAVSDVSFVTHTVPGRQVAPDQNAILFRWGIPESLSSYSAQIGSERLALVVNPANSLTSLTLDLAQGIASGTVATWDEVNISCPDCFASAPTADLLTQAPALNFYSAGEEPQVLFENQVMQGSPVGRSTALLIPSVQAMKEAVAASSASFGFLPAHMLDSSIKEISIKGLDPKALEQPILAISQGEPQGVWMEWLACLQQNFK